MLDPSRDTLINVNGLGNPVPSARFMGGREFDFFTEGAALVFEPDDLDQVAKSCKKWPTFDAGFGYEQWTFPRAKLDLDR